MKLGVILGQNCSRLSEAALNNLFQKIFLSKYAMNIWVAQMGGALLQSL